MHSLREGFGRCVVEGRLAGCRVICSDIAEFAVLRDGAVHVYRNAGEFMAMIERIASMPPPTMPYAGYPYRTLLRAAVERVFAAPTSVPSGRSKRVTPA